MGNIIDIIYLSNGRLNWHAIEGIIAAIVAIIVIIELLPKLKGLFDSKKKMNGNLIWIEFKYF